MIWVAFSKRVNKVAGNIKPTHHTFTIKTAEAALQANNLISFSDYA